MRSIIQIIVVCGIISIALAAQCSAVPENDASVSNCLAAIDNIAAGETCCFVDGPKPSCQSYKADTYQSLKADFNQKFDQLKATNIEQVHCGTKDENCLYLVLDEKARSKCTDKDKQYHSTNNKCCFVTVEYKYNSNYFCYPAPAKDETKLKDLTDAMKIEYFGAKDVSIDCFAPSLTLPLLSLLFLISSLLL